MVMVLQSREAIGMGVGEFHETLVASTDPIPQTGGAHSRLIWGRVEGLFFFLHRETI